MLLIPSPSSDVLTTAIYPVLHDTFNAKADEAILGPAIRFLHKKLLRVEKPISKGRK